jgi:hypothetical protein
MGIVVEVLTALIGAGIGFYFGAYFRKKGQNLATREDLDKLVAQVEAVTTAAKEIEARVSDEAWNREKTWELKRDVLLEGMKGLGEYFAALWAVCSTYRRDADSIQERGVGDGDARIRVLEEWDRVSTDFIAAKCFVVSLVGSKDLMVALAHFGKVTRRVAIEVSGGKLDVLQERAKELEFAISAVAGLLSEELGYSAGGAPRAFPS